MHRQRGFPNCYFPFPRSLRAAGPSPPAAFGQNLITIVDGGRFAQRRGHRTVLAFAQLNRVAHRLLVELPAQFVDDLELGPHSRPLGSTLAGNLANDATVDELITIPANRVLAGTNVLAVQVHQSAATSSDIVFGLAVDATKSQTNCVQAPVVINEILANNETITNADGTVTGWVEL